jgi:N-acetylneuraminate synthase
MLGNSVSARRVISREETKYLDALVRGVYARRDLPAGYELSSESFAKDFKLAVPLRKGQLSTREILNGLIIVGNISAGAPVTINDINGPFSSKEELRQQILDRGV